MALWVPKPLLIGLIQACTPDLDGVWSWSAGADDASTRPGRATTGDAAMCSPQCRCSTNRQRTSAYHARAGQAGEPAAASVVGGIPLMQSGSGQPSGKAADAVGGTPLMQSGVVQLMSVVIAGCVPLKHFGSVHSLSDARAGGVPPVHLGSGQLSEASAGGTGVWQSGEPVHTLAAGGGPPLQSGEPLHALAGTADRAYGPAVTASMTAASPTSLRISTVVMIWSRFENPSVRPRSSGGGKRRVSFSPGRQGSAPRALQSASSLR